MDELRVRIEVSLTDEGVLAAIDRTITVPPDYNPRDIEPFVQHEIDKAVTTMQQEAFGYSRSDRIIAQFDRRMQIIKRLLRIAPHDIRKRPIIKRVREVIDMDRGELFARYGHDENVEG